jgi:hypothetical protein
MTTALRSVAHFYPGPWPTFTSALTIGAWSDMDFDETLDALDRIRHESKPTPPIDLSEFE